MKFANPERTLGEVMAEQGKRPYGWYEMETLIGAVKGLSPDWVRIDDLTIEQTRRLRRELAAEEHHPWRYEVDRSHPGGMVSVRAVQQKVKVPETQPQRLGSRAWEADPRGFFETGHGPVLSGSEHDPRLGPDVGLDDDNL